MSGLKKVILKKLGTLASTSQKCLSKGQLEYYRRVSQNHVHKLLDDVITSFKRGEMANRECNKFFYVFFCIQFFPFVLHTLTSHRY